MRIDVHAHYWTDDYLDMLVKLGKTDTDTQRGMGAGGGDDLAARLRLMDRAGVELQVLSAAPQLPYAEDRKKATAGGKVRQRPVRRGHRTPRRPFPRVRGATPAAHRRVNRRTGSRPERAGNGRGDHEHNSPRPRPDRA